MRNQIRRTDVSGVFGVSAALLRSHRIGCSSFTRFVANRNELSAFRFPPSSLFPLPSAFSLQPPSIGCHRRRYRVIGIFCAGQQNCFDEIRFEQDRGGRIGNGAENEKNEKVPLFGASFLPAVCLSCTVSSAFSFFSLLLLLRTLPDLRSPLNSLFSVTRCRFAFRSIRSGPSDLLPIGTLFRSSL